MEGHNTGGHGALEGEDREEMQSVTETIIITEGI